VLTESWPSQKFPLLGEGQGEAGLMLPLTLVPLCQADAVADKTDQKRKCLSAASFCASRLGSCCGGNPRSGRRDRGRLLFAYFILGEARKSERLPGRTRLARPKKKTKRSTEERREKPRPPGRPRLTLPKTIKQILHPPDIERFRQRPGPKILRLNHPVPRGKHHLQRGIQADRPGREFSSPHPR
jgi:hypothetical protein